MNKVYVVKELINERWYPLGYFTSLDLANDSIRLTYHSMIGYDWPGPMEVGKERTFPATEFVASCRMLIEILTIYNNIEHL